VALLAAVLTVAPDATGRWQQLCDDDAQVMQSYLPGPSTYLLSNGAGIRCRAAQQRGHDIVSLEVGAAVCSSARVAGSIPC
jgi:hypothetical protein